MLKPGKSLALPAVIAFFLCILCRPFIKTVASAGYEYVGCSNLMPKLLVSIEYFDLDQVCYVNNYLWYAIYFLILSYILASFFTIIANFRHFSLYAVRSVPAYELILI